MDSYLFWSFVRKFNALTSKQWRIQYGESIEVIESLHDGGQNWVSTLENEILVKEVASRMDMKTRRMLVHRLWGYSWSEIGEELGISARNAEAQFSYGLKRTRERIFGNEAPEAAKTRKGR